MMTSCRVFAYETYGMDMFVGHKLSLLICVIMVYYECVITVYY